MKSILDQFSADALNAPENVTGGSGRRTHRRTHRRTRSGDDSSNSSLSGRRTHRRTHRHTRGS